MSKISFGRCEYLLYFCRMFFAYVKMISGQTVQLFDVNSFDVSFGVSFDVSFDVSSDVAHLMLLHPIARQSDRIVRYPALK